MSNPDWVLYYAKRQQTMCSVPGWSNSLFCQLRRQHSALVTGYTPHIFTVYSV